MAEIETIIRVPEFDRNNIKMYLDELTTWVMVTKVEKKKQGPMVWVSLPKIVIKYYINDSIGLKNLNKDDGIGKLIAAIKRAFEQESEIEVFSK